MIRCRHEDVASCFVVPSDRVHGPRGGLERSLRRSECRNRGDVTGG